MKYTFTVEIEFSANVLACAEDAAQTHGADAARHYLERKVDRALEGGYFESVEVTLVPQPEKPTVAGFELEDGSTAYYSL